MKVSEKNEKRRKKERVSVASLDKDEKNYEKKEIELIRRKKRGKRRIWFNI